VGTAPPPASPLFQPLTSLGLRFRSPGGPIVGRPAELAAVAQELRTARGTLAALTLEGEPGIGKTRLLTAAAELATAEGFTVVGVTADEELRGSFLIARSILTSPPLHELASGTATREVLRRALDAMSGQDEPGLEGLGPEQKLLRVFDLAAVALRAVAAIGPLALLIDDMQWSDEDSVRLLRYVVRTDAASRILLVLSFRADAAGTISELTRLTADMERLGLVRRLKVARLTQIETAELLRRSLGGDVQPSTAATIHAQAEGVPFIVEELGRTYRATGAIQQIDGVWTLASEVERLIPSAVRTLIQRRAARLAGPARAVLGEAALLGRSFSLRDLEAVGSRLRGAHDAAAFAEMLQPAVAAGLLVEHPEGAAADYTFTHEQIREFAASGLPSPRRRQIHVAIVDLLTGDGEPADALLPLIARHAVAAGDAERAARFSLRAAEAALRARAPEEVLRLVDLGLPLASTPQDRVPLLRARDDGLAMLRRTPERLETLSELAALAEALGRTELEFDVLLRRAAARRAESEFTEAADIARSARQQARGRDDRGAEVAACLELGQDLLRIDLGEGVSTSPADSDLDGAEEAFERAAALAGELGDTAALAASTRELGVCAFGRMLGAYDGLARTGALEPVYARLLAGEPPERVLGETGLGVHLERAMGCFQRALALFEGLGDRRGVMSSIIGLAHANWGPAIHFYGAAQRLEDLRRLSTRFRSFTTESERATAEAQMIYGVQVFALAKGAYDLALSRGEDGYRAARAIGDRSLEFLTAGRVALAHLVLGEITEAEAWLQRAADAAAAAPTPTRAWRLEVWRGLARAAADDPRGMQAHFRRALEQAAEQGRPADRCETLAELALAAARLGATAGGGALLTAAENAANEAQALAAMLPGHAPWGPQAGAALALVHLARGRAEDVATTAEGALQALDASRHDDLPVAIVVAASRALLSTGDEQVKLRTRARLAALVTMVAQRTVDDAVRARFFCGPLGRELAALGASEPSALAEGTPDGATHPTSSLDEDDSLLLGLLVEGRTNAEIASRVGVAEDEVVRRLGRLFAKLAASSRAEATAFALRDGLV